jgi:hypothetical protein
MATLFTESAIAPVKAGDNWRAVLITPGKGSSGIYTESMLKEYGAQAFPKGTHSYVDHPVSEGEIRSPKNLMGVLAEDAYYDEAAGGLVAELQVMPHWKDFVEAVAPHTGLSIYAMGEGNRNDDGDVVVESLVPNIQNSVDLVSYAGRPGSGLAEKLYESALAAQTSDNGTVAETATAPIPTNEEGIPNMDEIMAKLEEMNVAIDAKFAAIAETLSPVEEPEEVEEVSVEAVAEALIAANLPEVSRKAVFESLRNGADLTAAIEGQKAFVESVKSHLKESAVAAPAAEETIVVNTVEKAASLRDILNVKVG